MQSGYLSLPPKRKGLLDWYSELPIIWRLMVPFTSLGLVISLFFFWYIPQTVHDQAFKELKLRAETVGEMIAANLAPMMQYNDNTAADELLSRAEVNKDLRFEVALSDNGMVFKAHHQDIARKHDAFDPAIRHYWVDHGVFLTRVPIVAQGQHLGTFTMGFSLKGLDGKITQSRWIALAIAFFLFVGSVIVSWLVATSMARTVGRIVKACESLSVGDLDNVDRLIPEKTSGSDEFSRMINAFREALDYISEIAKRASQIANGDLAKNVAPKGENDQLGNSIYQMVLSLREVVGKVRTVAESVGGLSTQIKDSSGRLATTSQAHTTVTEATLSSIEEMAASTQEVAANVDQANQATSRVDEEARQGGQAVAETVAGMESINRAIEELTGVIRGLDDRSQQIGAIIEMIGNIAKKTNLLALNAAIEAARAGDAGRGFAVVADEVRKLAEQSAQATGEIEDLIRAVQSEAAQAVEASQKGAMANSEGLEKASKAGATLARIQAAVSHATQMMLDISNVTGEQSQASLQILKAAEQMAAFNNEVNDAMRVMAKDAQTLDSQAQDLLDVVAFFNVQERTVAQASVPASRSQSRSEPGAALRFPESSFH